MVVAMCLPAEAHSQDVPSVGVVGTALQLRQLDGEKRVLLIAAHPDDEDTALLTTLARGMGAKAAYLSLTRGEGGQNLIGPEMHEGLGIIRTGELVAARELDGAEQYFTRAFDFGFSKNMEESFAHWPRQELLRDVVWVIRTFRPHVIVAVFSGTPRDGHGQHQVAGVMAQDGYALAGDPTVFPEMADMGAPAWTVSKLYRSARFSPNDATATLPTGNLDPVLGRSHHQLAMASRSQHRSQDMGVGQSMGPRESSLQLLDSRVSAVERDTGIFHGVDTTFVGQLSSLTATLDPRAPHLVDAYRESIHEAEELLSPVSPGAAVPALATAAANLDQLHDLVADRAGPAGHPERRVIVTAADLVEDRKAKLAETGLAGAGVIVDVRAGRDLLIAGEAVIVDVTVWNGGIYDVAAVTPTLKLPQGWSATPTQESAQGQPGSRFFRQTVAETPVDGRVPAGTMGRWSWSVIPPEDAGPSELYFLASPRTSDLYTWPDNSENWARPFNPSPIRAQVRMELEPNANATARFPETEFTVTREAEYVGVDKAFGEYRQPLLVVPALSVAVTPEQMVWPTRHPGARSVTVVVTNSSSDSKRGTLSLDLPEAWTATPSVIDFELGPDGANRSFEFEVTPTQAIPAGHAAFKAVVRDDAGRRYDRGFDLIDYPHIQRTAFFKPSEARVSAFDVVADASASVGYIMGSGDDGPEALRQMGVNVTELDEAQVRAGNFATHDVVVLGVRAYETRPDLVSANEALLEFARNGGTVIVQYNKYEFPAGGFAPYPVNINRPHDRVTDETATVTLLEPDAPIFAGPNRLGPQDFEGWVQERGLYFLGEWDEAFTPLMEMADPGEAPKRGALMVASHGQGLYVYTGLAFFRQFPAGVPGAYRLFANLVSLRPEAWQSRPAMEN